MNRKRIMKKLVSVHNGFHWRFAKSEKLVPRRLDEDSNITPHNRLVSAVFLKRPIRLLEKVACRLFLLSIFRISIFRRHLFSSSDCFLDYAPLLAPPPAMSWALVKEVNHMLCLQGYKMEDCLYTCTYPRAKSIFQDLNSWRGNLKQNWISPHSPFTIVVRHCHGWKGRENFDWCLVTLKTRKSSIEVFGGRERGAKFDF